MPIKKYTGAGLKKLNKLDLISHIVKLYQFIDVFSGESIVKLKEEIEEKEKENEELKKEVNDRVVIEDIAHLFGKDEDDFDWEDEIGGLVLENKELKKEAKKIEAAVRSSTGDALDLCLPIWYGEDENED